MSTQGGTSDQTVRSEPPGYVVPYLQRALQRGEGLLTGNEALLGDGRQFLPEDQYNADEQAGMDRLRWAADQPQLATGGARWLASDTIGGQYLDDAAPFQGASPLQSERPTYYGLGRRNEVGYELPDRVRDAAVGEAMQAVRSGFEGAGGRAGSSMEALATGEGITRALSPLYSEQFRADTEGARLRDAQEEARRTQLNQLRQGDLAREQAADLALTQQQNQLAASQRQAERNRQQQMAGMSGRFDEALYRPGQALVDLGSRQFGRETLYRRAPWDAYQAYVSTALGNPAGVAGNTQTRPVYQPSPITQALGLGASIAGLGGPSGFGWWGT